MLPESALKQMYPIVMTPSHDRKFFQNYVLSLLNLSHTAQQIGMPLQIMLQGGESLITRARNNCVANFMQNPQWTHLLFIDADIGFSAEAVFRLLLADRDIAAGVYPLKRERWPEQGLPAGMTRSQFEATYTQYTVNMDKADEKGEIHLHIDSDGFLSVDMAPTGFMLIKRRVFDTMMAAYPELHYISNSDYSEDQGMHYRFFDCSVDPDSKIYLSEDYAFCRLWKRLGGKIFVDTRSNLTHQGLKTYNGPFAESLQENLPYSVFGPKDASLILHSDAPFKLNPKGPG